MWRGVLNIPTKEYLVLTPGEMQDLISCYQISNGIVEPQKAEQDEKYIPDLR
jgi:hypothetical protein